MKTAIFALSALAATSLLVVQAESTTLVNEDEESYRIEVIVGQGATTSEEMEIDSDEILSDFCMDGCIVRLDNGQEQQFEGFENAVIRNGEFIITE